MKENGYETYEISNYAKPVSDQDITALIEIHSLFGFRPSAHSFDGKPGNGMYLQYSNIWSASGIINPFEQEILSKQDFYNDYVMIALRTSEGIDINYLHERFGQELPDYCIQSAATHLAAGDLIMNGQYLSLSGTGIHIANIIIMDLIKV